MFHASKMVDDSQPVFHGLQRLDISRENGIAGVLDSLLFVSIMGAASDPDCAASTSEYAEMPGGANAICFWKQGLLVATLEGLRSLRLQAIV